MKITVLAIGQRQPAWAEAAAAEFLKRFPADYAVTVRQLRPEARHGQPIARVLAAEAQKMRAAIAEGTVIVALDEKGRDWTSLQLADQLGRWRDAAQSVTFLIGGADGLDPDLKRSAQVLLRLSSMTLPHAIARVLLIEQLYRAWSILAQHPYHRD